MTYYIRAIRLCPHPVFGRGGIILPHMFGRSLLTFLAAAQLCMSAVAQGPVCALSDQQERDAPAAFEKLMPLFMTKRCFNCHGGINPFVGSSTGQTFQVRGTHPELFDGEDKVVFDKDGKEDVPATFKSCNTCHNAGAFAAPNTWKLAPFAPDTQFAIGGGGIAKASVDLCKQVKVRGRVPGAAGFIGHMTNDNGMEPFLETAFAGTMALDPEQVDRAKDDLKDQGGYPAPITVMTRSQALDISKEWIADMGGKFRLPDDCGCKEHHYALRVSAQGMLQMPGFTFNLRFEGKGTTFPEIPLNFQDDGTLSGEVMATPVTDNQGSLPMISCSGERNNDMKVVVEGSWADITPTSEEPTSDPPSPPKNPIRVKLTFSQVQTAATETCSTPLGSISGRSNRTGPLQYPFELIFPDPQVDQAVAVDWLAPFPGWSGTVRAQIIEASGGTP